MPKDHARKKQARRAQRRSGASYTSAAAGTLHTHPTPDLSFLSGLPYSGGRPVDLDTAAALVAACRAGCRPCQESLFTHLLNGERARPTVALLAGFVLALWPRPISTSAAVVAWHPLARAAHDSDDGSAALAALEAMPSEAVEELLDEVLDHWALGGLGAETGSPVSLHILTLPNDPDDPDDGGDLNTGGQEAGQASYALTPGVIETSHGPLPILVLIPESPGAGPQDLQRRCGWPIWDLTMLPAGDFSWRVRLEAATRSLSAIVRVDDEGFDDLVLWEAAEVVTLPADWFNLIDRTEQVLVCGSAAGVGPELQAAAQRGHLTAVIARARFL